MSRLAAVILASQFLKDRIVRSFLSCLPMSGRMQTHQYIWLLIVLLSVILAMVGHAVASPAASSFRDEYGSGVKADCETGSYPLGQRIGWGIVINIPAFRLTLYEDWIPVRTYPIAIGSPLDPTPMGHFRVSTRITNPTWYPTRGGKPVPPGRENPIGSRWIGLSARGYGIHGTNSPGSIGKAVSLGCIRLHSRDAEDLFERVGIGTMVLIVYERVEIWLNEESGERFLVLHPDIYRSQPELMETVLLRLYRAGLDPEVTMPPIERVLDLGGPLTKSVTIRLGIPVYTGNRLAAMAICDPVLGILVPVRPIAERLERKLDYDESSGTALIEGNAVKGVNVDGRMYVPVSEIERMFNVTVYRDPLRMSLHVSEGPR